MGSVQEQAYVQIMDGRRSYLRVDRFRLLGILKRQRFQVIMNTTRRRLYIFSIYKSRFLRHLGALHSDKAAEVIDHTGYYVFSLNIRRPKVLGHCGFKIGFFEMTYQAM